MGRLRCLVSGRILPGWGVFCRALGCWLILATVAGSPSAQGDENGAVGAQSPVDSTGAAIATETATAEVDASWDPSGETAEEEAGVDAALEELELSPAQIDRLMTDRLGLTWEQGPGQSEIGDRARIVLPEGFRYLGQEGAHALLRVFDNIPGEGDLGLLSPTGSTEWFVVFSFDDMGYVKDDEKDKIDKEALLNTLRESSRLGNEQRRAAGISEMELEGWAVEPFYNAETNSLEWGLRYTSDGSVVVNYFTKQLGRRGVMNCNLVVSPEELDKALPEFRRAMQGFSYVSGETYAEFRAGDKVAEYGLTALVAGGALAVAAKSGLLGKLWKVIVFGVIALGAALKKALGAISGRNQSKF